MAIRAHQLVISVERENNNLLISAKNGSRVLPFILDTFEQHSLPVSSISIRSPSLEDVFIYLTGKKLDDGISADAKPFEGRERR
jgi:ABC-2 type transport system ATP-binding protein